MGGLWVRSLGAAVAIVMLLSQDVAFGPSDKSVGAALRNLAATENPLKLPPYDRRAIEEFYRARGYKPVWFAGGQETDRARLAIARLNAADSEGLRPEDYAVPLPGAMADAAQVAAAELWLTDRLLAYARHVAYGRILPTQLGADISYPVRAFDRAAALTKFVQSTDIGATLASLAPRQAGYVALRQELAGLRASPPKTPGDRYVRQATIDTIVVNMERWRWMPRDLGGTYIVVNIPDFRLALVQDGKATWTTRTVVGARTWRTPIISANMTSITLNPIWHVPDSLVREELAIAGANREDYFERIGMRSFTGDDGKLHLYQLPNGSNSLGQIRFNFPNRFSVFQHDTPIKNLFDDDWRAYSHGCMRVEHPLAYAEKLLAFVLPNKDYTAKRLSGLLDGDEYEIRFPRPIPIHLTYQTAFVDASGALQMRDDIYGYDELMRKLLEQETVEKPRIAGSF